MDWHTIWNAIDVLLYILLAVGVIIGIVVLVRAVLQIQRFNSSNGQNVHWYNYSPILTALFSFCIISFFTFFNVAVQSTNVLIRIMMYVLVLVSLGGTFLFMMRAYKYKYLSNNIQEQISSSERREKSGWPKS